jgi:hypothetical protein
MIRSRCWTSLRSCAEDLAEALDAIAAVEQRDAVEVADRWFHDQPTLNASGAAPDPGSAIGG